MFATKPAQKEAQHQARKVTRRPAESVLESSAKAYPESSPESSSDRWQLTPESFQALLAALDRHEARAVVRYQRLHQRLVFFFMRHRAIHPEDLADICLNRLARKLLDSQNIDNQNSDSQRIENIEAFTLGIARMVLREDQAGHLRTQRAFSEWTRNKSLPVATSHEDGEKLDIMERHFSSLPESVREMLSSYHLGRGVARIERRQRLAQDLGITIGALRKRVFDLQAQLRHKVEKGRDHSLRDAPESTRIEGG